MDFILVKRKEFLDFRFLEGGKPFHSRRNMVAIYILLVTFLLGKCCYLLDIFIIRKFVFSPLGHEGNRFVRILSGFE